MNFHTRDNWVPRAPYVGSTGILLGSSGAPGVTLLAPGAIGVWFYVSDEAYASCVTVSCSPSADRSNFIQPVAVELDVVHCFDLSVE